MPSTLRFIYFGYQCPHNAYLLARIKTIAWRESVPLYIDDISQDPALCERYRIFSPTTLIVNDSLRWLGPFSKEDVLALLYDEELPEAERSPLDPGSTVEGVLKTITPESVLSTCESCLESDDSGLCMGKAEWTRWILREAQIDHLGYLHFQEGKCVGGAEFLPSSMVPYPIPDKRATNAFLTCSFKSNRAKDYRSFPMDKLKAHLAKEGYDTLSVVSSTNTTFPNGPVEWFESRGFERREVLIHEDLADTDLLYLQLTL